MKRPIKRPTGWKPHYDARLIRYFGFPDRLDDAQLAELFNDEFTPCQIRRQRQRLGLRRIEQRPWTPAEDARLRQLAYSGPWEQVAAALGRTTSGVFGRAAKLGIARQLKRHSYEALGLTEFLQEKHAAGWTDTEIASAWSRRHPRATISRSSVSERRRKLRLPDNLRHDRRRRRVARQTRQQLKRAGLKSLAELRVVSWRQAAARLGWPDYDLRPRAVQVLNLLYERGPHTRRQICEALGLRWTSVRKNGLQANAGRKYPGVAATYLEELVRHGLVVRVDRVVRTGRRGGNLSLYAVAPHVRRKPCPSAKPSPLPRSRESCSPKRRPTRPDSGRPFTTASRSPMSPT